MLFLIVFLQEIARAVCVTMDWRWDGSSWARLWWQPLSSSGYLICTSSLDKFIHHGHLAVDTTSCVNAMNAIYLLLGISCYCYSLFETKGFLIFILNFFFNGKNS
jgi:hypothetical protein